jgi:hypothetical protein
LKIERDSQSGKTTVRLIGRFQSAHIGELEKQLQSPDPQCVLDLKEVTLVDVEVVRFLNVCESRSVEIVHCSQYIREWMVRERKAGTAWVDPGSRYDAANRMHLGALGKLYMSYAPILTAPQIERIRAFATPRQAAAGEILYEPGDATPPVFTV